MYTNKITTLSVNESLIEREYTIYTIIDYVVLTWEKNVSLSTLTEKNVYIHYNPINHKAVNGDSGVGCNLP